jgi:hypothetical protein
LEAVDNQSEITSSLLVKVFLPKIAEVTFSVFTVEAADNQSDRTSSLQVETLLLQIAEVYYPVIGSS